MEQRTQEWFEARSGKVTASKFSAVLTNARSKVGLSKTAESYMHQIIAELMTGQSDSYSNEYMEWGTEQEPSAIEAYELHNMQEVIPVGFIKHPKIELVGGSSDGFVGEDGIIEVKCPKTTTHFLNYMNNPQSRKYMPQIQGNLWVADRKWCDYVSYDPRIIDVSRQLYIQKIARDDNYIKILEEKVLEFLKIYKQKLKELNINL